MSAYASLPGSFLPPFFAFGTPPPSNPEADCSETSRTEDGVDTDAKVANTASSQLNGKESIGQPRDALAPPGSSRQSSDISPSAFKALALSTKADDSKASHSIAPPSPSDIIIAFQSARVDPVQLIKSLTSTGSNIARRTANFIARTPEPDANNSNASGQVDDATKDKDGRSSSEDVVPLCYEDTDSDSDEEYSMYDYSEDFSTAHDDDDEEHVEEQATNTSGDPSSIEFELSITYQGRKYNATRTFPTFVKLREDLLHELKSNDKRSRRSTSSGRAKSPDNSSDGECPRMISTPIGKGKMTNETFSVPELPRVSPESLTGHAGCALSGVARSGFALLQATAQHYCPEMEFWMMSVIDAFPYSQTLSNFLWEPLDNSSSGWESIGEGKDATLGSAVFDCQTESINPLNDASTSTKPPMHTRSKPKSSNSSKMSRNKFKRVSSAGSFGSLNSINEAAECDDLEDDYW